MTNTITKTDQPKCSSNWRTMIKHWKLPLLAIFLLCVFGIIHLLGWRQDTAILSGTLPEKNADAMIMRGLAYGAAYFAAVVISPILLLTAVINALLKPLFQKDIRQ